jgi:trk system potassium uptake protein TrkH
MSDSTTALSYAIRLGPVGGYLSQLGLMLVLLSLPSLAISLLFAEYEYSLRYTLVIGGLLLAAIPGLRLREPEQVQINEALAIVGLVFVLTPLIMAFPMAASGLPFEDVLFEAVSAITTTGLSTVGSIEQLSPTFLFARAWMQWYGGLGIAVLSVALLMGHHAAARRLADPTESENIATTARTQARQVLRVYLVLTLAGILLLWVLIGDPFTAVVHMLATLSTGGFSSFDHSIADLPRSGAWLVTLFSLFGAVPLLLYFHAVSGRPTHLVRDPEVRALVAAVLLLSGLLSLSLYSHSGLSLGAALQNGTMLGVSAQTTAGFSSLPVGQLDATSKLLMIGGMLIGGGSGSTAGGIKLLLCWSSFNCCDISCGVPPCRRTP